MKKVYLKPCIEEEKAYMTMLLCGSVTSDKGIGYGGVDEDGTKDPASRRWNGVWDDEEF